MLQMAVLVLAVGVPGAFVHQQFFGVTLGCFIMRIALVSQWIRAAVENPAGRTTALRYAGGIVVVQASWILRLLLPPELGLASFVGLALLDVSVSAATIAVQSIIASRGVSLDLVIIAAAGLVLWWLYFMESAAEGLSQSPTHSFLWGYGYYPLTAAIALVGAMLTAVSPAGRARRASALSDGRVNAS